VQFRVSRQGETAIASKSTASGEEFRTAREENAKFNSGDKVLAAHTPTNQRSNQPNRVQSLTAKKVWHYRFNADWQAGIIFARRHAVITSSHRISRQLWRAH
jgi:hypothetical protein